MKYAAKYLFFFLLLVFSMFSFVSAVPPVTTVQDFPKGYLIGDANTYYLEINQPYTHHWFVKNATNGYRIDNTTVVCMIYITDNSGTLLFGSNATYSLDGYWYQDIPGDVFNDTQLYFFGISCINGGIGGGEDGEWKVTQDGIEASLERLIANFLLLVVIVFIMMLIYYKHSKTDFKEWGDKIVDEHKNMGQTMANGMIYSLFKNTFLWYYFLGWMFIVVLKNIIFSYCSLEIYSYFTIMANIYSLAFLLVTVFFIGYTITFFRNAINILTDNNWGVGD